MRVRKAVQNGLIILAGVLLVIFIGSGFMVALTGSDFFDKLFISSFLVAMSAILIFGFCNLISVLKEKTNNNEQQ